jgi:signal peptidase I
MRISPTYFSAKRIIFSALALALGAAAWSYVGPERLGGTATYVMVHGSSMEPKLHAGDLVIVQRANAVKVGDVVAYRSHDLRVPVLHRIVGIENGNYKFKGDNNGWIDRESVAKSDLMGTSWVRVPMGGTVLEWTRTPSHAPLLTIPAALLLLGGFGKKTPRRARAAKKLKLRKPKALRLPNLARAAKAVETPRLRLPALPALPKLPLEKVSLPRPSLPAIPGPDAALIYGPIGQGLLVAVCLVATAAAFLGFLAYGRPASTSGAQTIAYKQEGTFSYSAPAKDGYVYDKGGARTGQPVFLRLSRAIDFRFTYALKPDAKAQVSGKGRLTAVVKDTNGWSRTIALGQAKRLDGKTMTLRGRLDLEQLRTLIKRVESATGVLRAGYQVAITPQIDVAGIASGRGFSDHFAPELQFQLDSLQLAPVPAAAGGGVNANPFHPKETGSLELQGTTAQTIRLFTARVEVRSARRIALVGGFLALLGASALALLTFRGRKVSEAERINARHGWSMIPVTPATSSTGRASVKVGSMDALVRLAERRDEAVLHAAGDGFDSYFFEEGGIVYWYRTPPTADDLPPFAEPEPVLQPVKAANGNGRHANGNGNGSRRAKVLGGRS